MRQPHNAKKTQTHGALGVVIIFPPSFGPSISSVRSLNSLLQSLYYSLMPANKVVTTLVSNSAFKKLLLFQQATSTVDETRHFGREQQKLDFQLMYAVQNVYH